jgi:hypothetical protein
MPLFTVNRTSAALSTTADYLTIIASATKPLRIYVVDLKGDSTSSAANEVLMCRSSSGSGFGGAITPVKVNTNSAAASFSVYTSASGAASLGDVLWRFSVNANGGIDKFVAVPGAEFQVPVSGQVSIRSTDGTSNVIGNLLVEEVDG